MAKMFIFTLSLFGGIFLIDIIPPAWHWAGGAIYSLATLTALEAVDRRYKQKTQPEP